MSKMLAPRYGIELKNRDQLEPAQCVVLAVAHGVFVEHGWSGLCKLLAHGQSVVADVKGVLDRGTVPERGLTVAAVA